jgi:hypothetical protein
MTCFSASSGLMYCVSARGQLLAYSGKERESGDEDTGRREQGKHGSIEGWTLPLMTPSDLRRLCPINFVNEPHQCGPSSHSTAKGLLRVDYCFSLMRQVKCGKWSNLQHLVQFELVMLHIRSPQN